MTESLNDPWHTAVHEAGHAVVGRKLGLDMEQSSADRDDDSAGHSIVGDHWANLDRWWREGRPCRQLWDVACARVLMLMAGAEAEVEILGALQDINGESGDGEDRREIDRLMEYHPREEENGAVRLASLRRSARRLVRRHRVLIERVAAELQARGTVPGHDLDAMVPGPPPAAPDPAWEAMIAAKPDGMV